MQTELWVAWTRELYDWWQYYNREYLDSVMIQPSIRLEFGGRTLGRWHPQSHTITIAVGHIERDSWQDVTTTLRHEMAHQYVDEVLGLRDELPHGPAFREACRLLRVDARATRRDGDELRTDVEGAEADGPLAERSRLLRVVEKLLSLGQSPNENEAALAMRKARELLTRHNIELVELDRERTFGVRALGQVKARRQRWEHTLASILGAFFFVEGIWSPSYDAARNKSGSQLFVYGTEENLDMAEYVHGFLTRLLEQLWRGYRNTRKWKGTRDRMDYFDGVLNGLWQKLRAQRIVPVGGGEALVWTGDPKLKEFYRWHNPRTRRVSREGGYLTAAWSAGQRAGRDVTIHKPVRGEGGFAGYLESN